GAARIFDVPPAADQLYFATRVKGGGPGTGEGFAEPIPGKAGGAGGFDSAGSAGGRGVKDGGDFFDTEVIASNMVSNTFCGLCQLDPSHSAEEGVKECSSAAVP